ncbi:uncharacterized protein MYCGRDRAFT_96369 [Zymoseptoria tritici IPO323]|uniref:Uncharacterized protein n=1 Tax=Zymoseptoria tritici (strain CBS 115943 / IPO323) TaxID=336722 RepID=F9XLW7_ZYMTI|nr:uncharacterized protein MYCGRDRAFT_96369 [Zymoseptoria tritici IPO323]EGP84018.1 hypothetical protein MYCGRDRAFT_96369 [Zymoseptoria tritici IPO323]
MPSFSGSERWASQDLITFQVACLRMAGTLMDRDSTPAKLLEEFPVNGRLQRHDQRRSLRYRKRNCNLHPTPRHAITIKFNNAKFDVPKSPVKGTAVDTSKLFNQQKNSDLVVHLDYDHWYRHKCIVHEASGVESELSDLHAQTRGLVGLAHLAKEYNRIDLKSIVDKVLRQVIDEEKDIEKFSRIILDLYCTGNSELERFAEELEIERTPELLENHKTRENIHVDTVKKWMDTMSFRKKVVEPEEALAGDTQFGMEEAAAAGDTTIAKTEKISLKHESDSSKAIGEGGGRPSKIRRTS